MKFKLVSSVFVSLIFTGCSTLDSQLKANQNELSGPYLGQQPPGTEAKVFAPGVVSSEHKDLSGFFSPDMKAFYFTRKHNTTKEWQLISYELENNIWHLADTIPRVGRPFISPNGEIMHLGKKYRQRTNDGWSEIKSLGDDYEKIWIMRLTSSNRGTYVFDEATREGNGTLRYSSMVNGERQAPLPLPKTINKGKWNAHPFIAPDESYILWDGERETGFGGNDIYISFKQPDGSWGRRLT